MNNIRPAGALVLAVAFLLPPPAAAQDSAPASGPIAAAVRRTGPLPSSPSGPPSRKGGLIGAAIGAAGAAAVTYWAASTYGENEGGQFCDRCFWTWGAWTMPAGALVGALVGSQIARSISPQPTRRARDTVIAPVVARRGGGVVVRVRY
jgi:hypothetical protein